MYFSKKLIFVSGFCILTASTVICGKPTVYTLRLTGSEYRPEVYREGKYILRVGNPDLGVWKSFENVKSSKKAKKELYVYF